MPKYGVSVHYLVEAENPEEAWTKVNTAVPEIEGDAPYIDEPEEFTLEE